MKFPTAETAEELIFGHSLYVFNGRKQILRAEEKYDILKDRGNLEILSRKWNLFRFAYKSLSIRNCGYYGSYSFKNNKDFL